MSRPNPDYEGSFVDRFLRFIKGTYDPIAGKLETKVTDRELVMGEPREVDDVILKRRVRLARKQYELGLDKGFKIYDRIAAVSSVVISIFMIVFLLWTVYFLPVFGDPNAPENNEVAARYIENGLEETGAVNIVAGMILDYRAFDTFGESCVLFVASCSVLLMLRVDKDESPDSAALEEVNDRHFEPKNDLILQKVANFLVPVIIIFGIYVVLNGHLSPGGGFSGGAIIGSGLILYLTAYGFEKTSRFLNDKVVKILTVCALTFYCFAKSYSFFTGANHLHSIITPGTPGRLLSAGLIVYLNICVGIVVACTMYSFYALFRKGGLK